jgi:hypothetical protein
MLAAILDQVGNGAYLQAMLTCKHLEIGQAGHGAVGLEDLADHRRRRQAGERGQVAAGLGVSGAHQHAALDRLHRENVSGLDKICRPCIARDGHLDGPRTVCGGNTGINTLGGFDGHGEISAETRAIAVGHEGQIQLPAALFGQGQADQPARMGNHEIDGVGRDIFGGHDKVTLVLAVFFVNQYDEAAEPQLGHNLGNGGNAPIGRCVDFCSIGVAHVPDPVKVGSF